MKNKRKTVNEKLKEYHSKLLTKLLGDRYITRLNLNYLSFTNNKTGTIRIVSCPYLYKDGGVIYILRSYKKDIAKYIIFKKIEFLDEGLFGIGVDSKIDLKYRNKSELVVVSYVHDYFKNSFNNYLKIFYIKKVLNKKYIIKTKCLETNLTKEIIKNFSLQHMITLTDNHVSIMNEFNDNKKICSTLSLSDININKRK